MASVGIRGAEWLDHQVIPAWVVGLTATRASGSAVLGTVYLKNDERNWGRWLIAAQNP